MNPAQSKRTVLDTASSRRTFLRGAGVTMALPWLESVRGLRRRSRHGAAGGVCSRQSPPQALAVLFMGNGVNSDHWWAKGTGRARWSCARPSSRMAPFKAKMNVINGLFNKHATGVGIHPGQTGNILSGRRPAEGGRAARRHQHRPGARQPPRRGDRPAQHGPGVRAADHRLPRDELLDGLQLAHLLAERHLAGADGGLPVARLRQPLRQPRQPSATRASSTASASEAAGLSRHGQPADRAKLDEYLTSVREVEKRVERPAHARGPRPTSAASDRGQPVVDDEPRPTTACPRTSASTCG